MPEIEKKTGACFKEVIIQIILMVYNLCVLYMDAQSITPDLDTANHIRKYIVLYPYIRACTIFLALQIMPSRFLH